MNDLRAEEGWKDWKAQEARITALVAEVERLKALVVLVEKTQALDPAFVGTILTPPVYVLLDRESRRVLMNGRTKPLAVFDSYASAFNAALKSSNGGVIVKAFLISEDEMETYEQPT